MRSAFLSSEMPCNEFTKSDVYKRTNACWSGVKMKTAVCEGGSYFLEKAEGLRDIGTKRFGDWGRTFQPTAYCLSVLNIELPRLRNLLFFQFIMILMESFVGPASVSRTKNPGTGVNEYRRYNQNYKEDIFSI